MNDEVYCLCNKSGMPIKQRREKPRFEANENQLEQNYLTLIKNGRYNINQSVSNRWICKLFRRKAKVAKHIETKSLAIFFGMVMGDPPPREAYRRLLTCLYWLDQRIEKIRMICIENKIEIHTSDSIFQVKPPYLSKKKDLIIGDLSFDWNLETFDNLDIYGIEL